jgi:hypothetical protein
MKTLDWYEVIRAAAFVVAGMLAILYNRRLAMFVIRFRMRRWRRPHWIGKEPTPEVVQSAYSAATLVTRVMSVIVGIAFLVDGLLSLMRSL